MCYNFYLKNADGKIVNLKNVPSDMSQLGFLRLVSYAYAISADNIKQLSFGLWSIYDRDDGDWDGSHHMDGISRMRKTSFFSASGINKPHPNGNDSLNQINESLCDDMSINVIYDKMDLTNYRYKLDSFLGKFDDDYEYSIDITDYKKYGIPHPLRTYLINLLDLGGKLDDDVLLHGRAYELEAIQILLEFGANVHYKSQHGATVINTTLLYPDHEDTEAKIQMFLNLGVDINDGAPLFCLMRNSERNRTHAPTHIIKFMISKGAQINRMSVDGHNTLLHYAAADYNGSENIKLFVSLGLNVNARNKKGETPIFWVKWGWNGERKEVAPTLSTLLDLKANLNAVDNEGNNILHKYFIVRYDGYDRGLTNIQHFLSLCSEYPEPFAINLQNKEGKTALHYAFGIYGMDRQILNLLILAGADPHICDANGKKPMDYFSASKKKLPELLQFLKIKTDNA